jgi:CHAT domain-containing protein
MTAAEIRAAKLPWLIRRLAINVLPSLQSLDALAPAQDARDNKQRPFLGIGNPDFGKGLRIAALPSRSGPEQLILIPPLPETEAEVSRIAEVMRADPREDLFLGARASEKSIKEADLSRYRIVTFATHGILAGEWNGVDEPALVLSVPARPTAVDDGLLKASEIAALTLDADLVILSACNTAASDGRPGAEGLSGLANAFFYAGARKLVATHWEIPSAPAVEIATGMIEAHARLGRSDWSKSLQTAVVQMIDRKGPPQFAHPGAWGAHMVIGTATAR